MTAYPVVNLGRARQYLEIGDFNAFFNVAKGAVRTVAGIARAHGLSDDEEARVRAAVAGVEGATLPMAEIPEPGMPAAETPWWLVVTGSLLAGAIAAHLLL